MKRLGILLLVLSTVFTGCSNSLEIPFQWEHEIHLVSREDGSGTRGAFTELTHITSKNENGENFDHTYIEAAITNSTSVVMTAVSGDSHAIGYLSLGSLNNSVKAVTVDGIPPTIEEIKKGNYPIARPFLLATKTKDNPIINDFMEFTLSETGQTIVAENGYVPVSDAPTYSNRYLSGKIVIGGSSSVTPVIEKLKEAYLQYHPEVTIEVQQSDSTTGMASVISGVYDIGMSSRSLKESEISEGLVTTTIAMDGIVVIVNPKSPVENLTLEQVKEIFTGEISHWEDIRKESEK